MTEGRREKKRIKVNGAPTSGAPASDGDAAESDLNVADAVDVAFEDIMAEVGPRGRSSKASAATAGGAAAAGAPAKPAPRDEAASPGADDLAAALAERDEYLAHLQRLQAEFDNYRKRVQRDSETTVLRAGERVVESLLPVSDNMERALEAARKHEAEQLIEGVELVAGQLRAALESHGLEEIVSDPGSPFDPTFHEAVLVQAHDDYPEGMIVSVLQTGYLLHGRLLRPTKVIVSQ